MIARAAGRIRLLIVDDHTLFRESLVRLLRAEVEFDVAAQCGTRVEALRILHSRQIDVVLLDLDLGSDRGVDLLDDLQGMRFAGKVLLVTAGVQENDVPNLICKGIAGIVMKHNSPALLVQGIRDAVKGKVWFDQALLKRALEAAHGERSAPRPAPLTEREKEVLLFIFEGLTNKEIGDRIHSSESAVKACLQNLFSKTGVRTRSQLVRVALERYRDQL